jgi:N-acetyl-anhydromuramyl-L-alanine amidase AmpD
MSRLASIIVAVVLAVVPTASVVVEAASRERPPMKRDYIPFGDERKRQMGGYSKRHYGVWRWKLTSPDVVVLHFTGGSTYESARNHFASNSPNRGEMPGVCAHFVVDKDGTIYKVVRTSIRCRHAIGLNYTSIGIEMVQETGSGARWADRQILQRRPQIRAALKLVRFLKKRYSIKMRNIIGHAMVNDSPYFKDLQGWRSDHTDWLKPDVREFRRRLERML